MFELAMLVSGGLIAYMLFVQRPVRYTPLVRPPPQETPEDKYRREHPEIFDPHSKEFKERALIEEQHFNCLMREGALDWMRQRLGNRWYWCRSEERFKSGDGRAVDAYEIEKLPPAQRRAVRSLVGAMAVEVTPVEADNV